MFIRNVDVVNNDNLYQCSTIVGNYLIKSGIPELSRGDNYVVFAKTKKLQKAIDTMPFYLKLLIKAGVING